MFTLMKSRSYLKLGHIGSESRSQGQILEKPCIHFGRNSFDPVLMNLCQNVCHGENKDKFESGSC